VQGPEALISTIFRELELLINHVLQVLREQYPDYTIEADYSQMCPAISMVKNGGGEVFHPIPWLRGPAPDGSTVEFESNLRKCEDFMHTFAMHTPVYFLANTPGAGPIRGLRVNGVSHDGEEEESGDEDEEESEGEAPQKAVSERPTTGRPCHKPKESTGTGQGNLGKRKSSGRKGLYPEMNPHHTHPR
jgi:hypothetical protein